MLFGLARLTHSHHTLLPHSGPGELGEPVRGLAQKRE